MGEAQQEQIGQQERVIMWRPIINEMIEQAKRGHKQFCAGVHWHENGDYEYEWISWEEAFEQLVQSFYEGIGRNT